MHHIIYNEHFFEYLNFQSNKFDFNQRNITYNPHIVLPAFSPLSISLINGGNQL